MGRDPDRLVLETARAVDGTPEMVPELAEHLGFLLWRAHARVLAALGEVLPPGVDIHGYAALLALDGGVTRSQQAVAETIHVSGTTMVRVAGELAAQGLIERVRNPEDRRSYALTRTPEGDDAAKRWSEHARSLEKWVTIGLTDDERDELSRLLHEVLDAELGQGTPEALRESVSFLISKLQFRMHREFLEALAPLRIEPRHFGVLTALAKLGPVPQAQLARTLGVSGAAVVQMIDDLQARGLVRRERLESDRRSQVLHLTPEATDVQAEAGRLSRKLLDARLTALSKAQRKRLATLMLAVVTAAPTP